MEFVKHDPILTIGVHVTPTGWETQKNHQFCDKIVFGLKLWPEWEPFSDNPEHECYGSLPSTMVIKLAVDRLDVLFAWARHYLTDENRLVPQDLGQDHAIMIREYLRELWGGKGWLGEKPLRKRGRPKKVKE